MTDPYGGTLTLDVLERLDQPRSPALARRAAGGWQRVTIGEFHSRVTAVAKGLIAAGVGVGDRVTLLSSTRYEWTVADYAIWWAGAVTVPIYETSSPEQVAYIVSDSGAVAGIAETPRLAELLATDPTWVISTGGMDALVAAGVDVTDQELEERRASITAESPATIVYTSGTTTLPRGCVLTHGNLRAELAGAIERLPDLFTREDASTLLVLPLAHVFARVVQIGAIRTGTVLAHASQARAVTDDLATFGPTFLLAVPRVFERALNAASTRAYADGRGKMFDRAVAAAIAYSRGFEGEQGKPGVGLRARQLAYEKRVYEPLRQAFGGRLEWAVCGGAPLGERLAHFLRGAGINILEGYGLTETSAAVCVNSPREVRIGTVGRPLPGVELRLAPDGELQVRGRQVFAGYWNDPEATAQVLDADGWFSTGDIAESDPDGFLRITGRKKEILVTAGGKNVAPGVLEDRVRAHPVVSHCLVVGDGKPFVGALVTIDRQTWEGPLDSPELSDLVQQAIDDANEQVSQAEAIRRFAIVTDDWTEKNGYLTPSYKVKRYAVLRDFHDTIETLFVR